jgi:hypothetical protein
MLRRSALRHPVPARQTDLQIKFHGIDPPALPHASQKDVGGRLLRRPRQDYPAATVADFCAAAYSLFRRPEKTAVNMARSLRQPTGLPAEPEQTSLRARAVQPGLP